MPLKKKKKAAGKKKAVKRAVRKTPVKKIKKKPARKIAKKRAAPVIKKQEGKVIGIVTHYFPKVNAAVIKLKASLTAGDTVKIKGHTTDFTQAVNSMQVNHLALNSAKKGEEIGLLVNSRVRQKDIVYKV